MSDQLVRAISKDGFVKAVAVSTRELTERARQIHRMTPVATAALGRTLAAASMMGNALKGEGSSVTLQIKGGGPLGTVLAVSDNEGNVRGTVGDPTVDLPLRPDGKLDVGSAVGCDGTLTVIRIPMMECCQQLTYKLGRPIVSTSANISGEPTPKKFADISDEIKNAVDYTVDPRLEAGATGLASQIIKIGLDGEVEIIRA